MNSIFDPTAMQLTSVLAVVLFGLSAAVSGAAFQPLDRRQTTCPNDPNSQCQTEAKCTKFVRETLYPYVLRVAEDPGPCPATERKWAIAPAGNQRLTKRFFQCSSHQGKLGCSTSCRCVCNDGTHS